MRGVVIGKFYPPHLGHNYLIDSALTGCDEVDVLVVDNPDYLIPAQRRREWLKARHPQAHVHIIPDLYDDDNSAAWAEHTIKFLGRVPDVVYSSESYGEPWATCMGCDYVNVDINRETVPISGTKVRQDLLNSWHYLSDEVKTGLAIRIVVIGAESTGTTTLSHDLAAALHVPWVPEIGRYYTESLMTHRGARQHDDFVEADWHAEDFHNIARLHQHYEDVFAARSDGIIVCDTNATATEVWQRRYIGAATEEMREIAACDHVSLYLITGDEIPFVQDGGRDGEHIRHTMHTWFIERAKKSGVPYVIVNGSREERLKKALAECQKHIKKQRKIGGKLQKQTKTS